MGIAWAFRLEPDPGSVGQRLLSLGSEPAKVAAAGTSPGLYWASRWPLVLVEHWEAGLVYVIWDSAGADERSYPMPEARSSGREELPHIEGVVAARVQEGLEELFHIQGQEGRW